MDGALPPLPRSFDFSKIALAVASPVESIELKPFAPYAMSQVGAGYLLLFLILPSLFLLPSPFQQRVL